MSLQQHSTPPTQRSLPSPLSLAQLKESLLATIKSYGIPLEQSHNSDKLDINTLRTIINEHESELAELTLRIGIDKDDWVGEYEISILKRADKYNIRYDLNNIDYENLECDVDNWESLLEKANNYNINWDSKNFDCLGLKQTIEEAEHKGYKDNLALYQFYLRARV